MNYSQSFKEVVRHFLYRSGLFSLLKAYRRRSGIITEHLDEKGIEGRFAEIYKRGVWRQSDTQLADSGLGSELHLTEGMRSELPHVLRSVEAKTLVDLGCGDWTWMSQIEIPCLYVGVDIVSDIVSSNRDAFGSPKVSFIQLDAVTQPIPKCDVVLCREVLFHLSFRDASAVIQNIKRHAEWLIATSDCDIWFNSDIPTGDFRMLNLQRGPFYFPRPDQEIPDAQLVPGRILGVWNTARL